MNRGATGRGPGGVPGRARAAAIAAAVVLGGGPWLAAESAAAQLLDLRPAERLDQLESMLALPAELERRADELLADPTTAARCRSAWRQLAASLALAAADRRDGPGGTAVHGAIARTLAELMPELDVAIERLPADRAVALALTTHRCRVLADRASGLRPPELDRALRDAAAPLLRALVEAEDAGSGGVRAEAAEPGGEALIRRAQEALARLGLTGDQAERVAARLRRADEHPAYRASASALVAELEIAAGFFAEPPVWLDRAAVEETAAATRRAAVALGGPDPAEAVEPAGPVDRPGPSGIDRRARAGEAGELFAGVALAARVVARVDGLRIAGPGGLAVREVRERLGRLVAAVGRPREAAAARRAFSAAESVLRPLGVTVETEAGPRPLAEAEDLLIRHARPAWAHLAEELAEADQAVVAVVPRVLDAAAAGLSDDPRTDPAVLAARARHRAAAAALEGLVRTSRFLEGHGYHGPLPAADSAGGPGRVGGASRAPGRPADEHEALARVLLSLSQRLRDETRRVATLGLIAQLTGDLGAIEDPAAQPELDRAEQAFAMSRARTLWLEAWTADPGGPADASAVAEVSGRVRLLAEVARWDRRAARLGRVDDRRLNRLAGWRLGPGVLGRLDAGVSAELNEVRRDAVIGRETEAAEGLSRLRADHPTVLLVLGLDRALAEGEAGAGAGLGGRGAEIRRGRRPTDETTAAIAVLSELASTSAVMGRAAAAGRDGGEGPTAIGPRGAAPARVISNAELRAELAELTGLAAEWAAMSGRAGGPGGAETNDRRRALRRAINAAAERALVALDRE